MERAPDPSVPGGGRVKITIKAPTIGLVTRIPSEQPDPRAAVMASNVRFDDGVIRNAPGYSSVILNSPLDSQPNLLFQARVTPENGVVPQVTTLMVGTGRYLYALNYLAEAQFSLFEQQTVKFIGAVRDYAMVRELRTFDVVPPQLYLFSIGDLAELWKLRARANTEADDAASYLVPNDWGLTNNVILARVR